MGSDLRQLDAEVAECLGWHETKCGSWVDKDGLVQVVCHTFEPSIVAKDCEAVKAEIRKRVLENRWSFTMDYVKTMNESGSWECWARVLIDTPKPGTHGMALSMTEYEAICRAYVAAAKGGQHVESR